jgi:hypothetical protein
LVSLNSVQRLGQEFKVFWHQKKSADEFGVDWHADFTDEVRFDMHGNLLRFFVYERQVKVLPVLKMHRFITFNITNFN